MMADLPLSPNGADIADEIEISFTTAERAQAPLGLPLFNASASDTAAAAEAGGAPVASLGRLGIKLHYAK